MFIKKTLIKYCLRRVIRRPVSLSVCILLTSFCVYCFLAVFNFYSSANQSSVGKQNLISISVRSSDYQLSRLNPLFDRIGKIAEVDFTDAKYIRVKAANNSQYMSLVQSLRSALDEKDFKIDLQSDYNQQTNEIVQSLIANILVVVLLLGLVSSLIIAGNAELSLIEGRRDLGRMQFMCCSNQQIATVVFLQFLLPSLAGSLLGLFLYYFFGNTVNHYLLQTLSAIPEVSTNTEISTNPYFVLFAIPYGIAISVFATLWAYYRQLILPKRKTSLHILKGRYFVYLCGLLVIITVLQTFRSKWLIAILIVNTLIFTAVCTYRLYNYVFKILSKSSWLALRLPASYLKANQAWINLPSVSIALSFTVLVSLITLLSSFDRTFRAWLTGTLNKDVFITAGQFNAVSVDQYLDKDRLAILFSNPGLKDFSYLSSSLERINSSSVLVHGSSESLEKLSKVYNLKATQSQLYSSGSGVLVNEIFARKLGQESFTFLAKRWEIIGIYRDFGSQLPTIIMPFAIFTGLTGIEGVSSISFRLNNNSDKDLVLKQIQAAFSDRYSVYSQKELSDQALTVFYKTFNFTKAMNVALLVLIISTSFLIIMLCLLQHLKALKLLQILGFSAALFWCYMTAFSILIVLPALIVGSISGQILADILVNSMNPALFGWSLDYYLPYSEYSSQTIFILISVIAGAFLCYCSRIKSLNSVEFSSE